MSGVIDFLSPTGEKISSTEAMTGVAPAKTGAIRLSISAKDVTGVQRDKNVLNILLKDNKKLLLKNFLVVRKRSLFLMVAKKYLKLIISIKISLMV